MSTPSPRRVMSASSKTNRNGAVATGTASKSVSTLSKGPSASVQTVPNAKSKMSASENLLTSTATGSVAGMNGNAPAAAPSLNLTPWKDSNVTVQTPKPQSKMTASKIPLRAPYEDVDGDQANHNVYIAPSTGTQTSPKPKMTAEIMYRDMPASEIDMNPKSPKSPKTEQSPQINKPVEQRVIAKKKKSKKKKSKDIPPAKIRSPTLEEKQARAVETFKLYDNPFQKQYEKIKEMHLKERRMLTETTNGGAKSEAEKDAKLIADIRMYQQLDPDNVPANNFIDSFEELVGRSHARNEAAMRDMPLTESLQKHSGVKVDVDGSAVGRAQDFWAEPNEILDSEGKDLNTTFKAALERAAGAKINTMVVGGSGGVGTYQAGTLFGAEVSKSVERSMLDTKDIETVLELGEKITNISLGPQKEAIAKKEEDLIRERVVDITYQAMEVSNNPKELAVNMRDLFPNLTIHACWVTDTITSKIGTHPRLLLNHGLYGTTIVSCVNYIIDKVYPMFATCKISDDEKALAWCEFITCSVKLWTFTEQQLEEHKDIKAVGLQTMNDLVVDSLQGLMKRDQGFPWTFDLKVLTNATIWFVEETCWTGGDFKLVVSLAEKALPSREILRRALDEENGWKLLGHPGRESTVETLGLNFEQLKVSVEKTKEEDAITETSSASKTAMPTKPETPTPSLAQSAINGADSNGKPQLKDYGYTIGEVVRNMRPIIAKVSNPVTATSKEQLADQNNFLSCGVALWNIIHMRLTHEEQIARKGLGLMAEAILHSLVKGTVTREFGITIMHRYTLWFIEEWAKAGSDLRIVKKEALKAMPNDQVEWSGFVGRECGHSKLPTPSSKLPELALTVKTKVQTATSKTLIAQLPAITPKAKPKKSPVLKPPTYTQAPTSTPKGGVFEPTEDTLEMILEYGYTIPQVISRMETILKALSKATPSTPEYDFAEADFIECSSALWYQVQQANRPVQSKKLKTGLELLCFAILGSLNDEGMSQAVRMNLNVKCSTWFMVQWKNASGDFEKVKEEALKELPDGTEDVLLFPRSAPSLLRSRLLAAMSAELSAGIGTRVMLGKVKSIDGTDKSTTTAPQKVVASRTVAEAKFEVPTVNKQVDTGDQEDIDASHESMEYIDPSSVVSTSGSLLNKAGPEVKSTQVNAGTGALLPKRAASALDPLISKSESGTNTLPAPAPITAEIPPLVIINNNPQEQIPKEIDADNKSDNMPNNMVPPTPPMTSEELSGHLVPDSDLHAIQNTLTILSHSLEQITTALYGTRSFHKTGTDANTIIDTDFRVEFCAGAHKAGMLFATNRLSELLKDLQSEIAAMSNKIGDLDTKIDSLHKDNKELKALAQELVENLRVREEKDGGEGEKMLKMLLDEVRGLKWDVEMLAEGREKEGERDGQYRVWLEKARELQGVVERAREVGGLREVLWPQGDGGFGVGGGGVSAEVKGEGEREKGVRRELYVKIGNQAGRGQGGGGFCGIM